MKWTPQELKNAVREHDLTVLVQCGPEWFPAGPWDRILGVDRQIIDLQRRLDGQSRTLLRILPYDLPPGSTETDRHRLQSWLDRVSLTIIADRSLSITVEWSTGRPYPDDGLYFGSAAEQIRSALSPSLIMTEEIRWRIADTPDHDPFWNG